MLVCIVVASLDSFLLAMCQCQCLCLCATHIVLPYLLLFIAVSPLRRSFNIDAFAERKRRPYSRLANVHGDSGV